MKQPAKKLRPPTLDITFCEPDGITSFNYQTQRSQCLSCARNAIRYDLLGQPGISFFSNPIIQPLKPCEYYIEYERKEL